MKPSILALLGGAAVLLIPTLTFADDFSVALSRHAQSTAREILSQWVDQRANGSSWSYVLNEKVPASLDSTCGFRNLVGLPDIGFTTARRETESVVGKRLEKTFGKLLSRPGAQLSLVDTRTHGLYNNQQAMVTLRVTPARPGDPTLSMLLELSPSGTMTLCDIASNGDKDKGVLAVLGSELNL